MRASDSLFLLIKSLSQAEKRYLQVYTQRYSKKERSQYASLLNLIWKQQEYNEAQVKIEFIANGGNITQFASLKNYLFGLVLQAMRDFHRAKNPQSEIEDMLEDVLFLNSHGIMEEANKLLRKAKNKAITYELHPLALQADSILRVQTLRDNDDSVIEVLEKLSRDSQATMTCLNLTIETSILYFNTLAIARRWFSIRHNNRPTLLSNIKSNLYLHEAKTSVFFLPRMYFLRTVALIAQLEHEYEDSFNLQLELYQLWIENPRMKELHLGTYIVSLANLLTTCHYTNHFDIMPSIIQQLYSLDPKSPLLKIEVRHNTLFYALLHAINKGIWATASTTAKDLETFLHKHETAIPKARVIAIRYNVAITYFFLEQFKPALQALNAILNDEQSRHREDIQQAARLMQAVVHYQLGNLDLLDYLLASVKRYLKNRGALHAFEETLIKHLKRLADNPHDKKEILQTLLQQLAALQADPDNAHAPGLEEVKYWVEATLKGCPLREVVNAEANAQQK